MRSFLSKAQTGSLRAVVLCFSFKVLSRSWSSVLVVLQAAQSKYIWLEELGRGRFGTTYLVQDKETGEHFAVKQISKTQPSFKRGRVLTEVKVHATVKDHPNVAGGFTTARLPARCIRCCECKSGVHLGV